MSIQQSLNAALTTSAALYTQSAGYKERQIQKLGKFAEAKEKEFSEKFAEIRPKIVKTKANLEKSKQKQAELNEDIKEIEKLGGKQMTLEEFKKFIDKGYKWDLDLTDKEQADVWKKQAASNLKRTQTAFAKAQNELDELRFKRDLYRNLYGGAR